MNIRKRSFFLLRLVLALLCVGIPVLLIAIGKNALKQYLDLDVFWVRLIYVGIVLSIIYASYAGYVKWIEKRRNTEYAPELGVRELSLGVFAGAGLVMVQVIILWIMGFYRVHGIAYSYGIVSFLFLNLIMAFLEELVSRGIVFRILEDGLGTWIALVLSVLEAGLTHAANNGATVLSTIAVGLEFGAMQTIIYMLTRRLWMVTGLHLAWNFTMGGIFGLNVSGMELAGLFKSTLTGPVLFTGGQWGIEAALPAILICSGVSVWALHRIVKSGGVRKPMWARHVPFI